MEILAAFDKFKDSISAQEACRITRETLEAQGHRVVEAPLTDGGEGFCAILTAAAGGEIERLPVRGPLGEAQQALLGFVQLEALAEAARATLNLPEHGRLAIVEMAQASGLELLEQHERDPWQTSTYGTGQLIARAVEAGAEAILVGIGGSATSDLGLGALEALGLEAVDAQGQPLAGIKPALWTQVAGFRGAVAEGAPPVRVACDVSNPLLGSNGAAAVYGPQKGLRDEDFARFDQLAGETATKLLDHFNQPLSRMNETAAGAAGGLGFGLRVGLGAQLVPGFELVCNWLNLEPRIAQAEAVITGEGKFDRSSLAGKGPYAVLQMAHARGKPCHVVAGHITEEARERLQSEFQASAHAIGKPDLDLPTNLAKGAVHLRETLAQLSHDL